ncbi:MAG: DUF1705 domain-containing protein, partial [Pseudoxanthomonas sp.]
MSLPMEVRLAARPGRLSALPRPRLSLESLLVLASVWFAATANATVWRTAISAPAQQWGLALALGVLLVAAHALLLGLLVWRWNARWLLTLLLLVTAAAAHFVDAYGVFLDPDMLRNVLATDHRESSELLTWHLLPPLLGALVPVALLWWVRIERPRWPRALLRRALLLGA